jgi:Ulp1 family protease
MLHVRSTQHALSYALFHKNLHPYPSIETAAHGTCLFDTDRIFFPHHLKNGGAVDHWALVVVFVPEKCVRYYCSLGNSGHEVTFAVLQYLQDKHLADYGVVLPNICNWSTSPCSADTPRQNNGWDCGVFTCMFVDRLMQMRDNNLFSQDEMHHYRRLILLCLVDKTVPIWMDNDGTDKFFFAEIQNS